MASCVICHVIFVWTHHSLTHYVVLLLTKSTNTQYVLLPHTFLCCPSCPGFTVHALKLVEIRTDLYLIHNALFECREDDTALRRDLHILGLPGSWWRQSWRLPIQNSVTLDELGLTIHLRKSMKTRLLLHFSAKRTVQNRLVDAVLGQPLDNIKGCFSAMYFFLTGLHSWHFRGSCLFNGLFITSYDTVSAINTLT